MGKAARTKRILLAVSPTAVEAYIIIQDIRAFLRQLIALLEKFKGETVRG